jgi:hypothetical protein
MSKASFVQANYRAENRTTLRGAPAPDVSRSAAVVSEPGELGMAWGASLDLPE